MNVVERCIMGSSSQACGCLEKQWRVQMGCFDCVQRWSRGDDRETARRQRKRKEAASEAFRGSQTKGTGEKPREGLGQMILDAKM